MRTVSFAGARVHIPFTFHIMKIPVTFTAITLATLISAVPDFRMGGRRGTHGMVVFGHTSSGLFLSHIPMYSAPHDVQTVFAVSFDGTFKQDEFSDQSYTILPARFALDDLVLGKLKQFQGTIYKGNFEADGKPLQSTVVTVKSMAVQAKRLVPTSANINILTYLVVGKKYLVHPVNHSNDFDHILALDGELQVNEITLPLPNTYENRLVPGTMLEGGVRVATELSLLVGPDFVSAQ